MDMTRRYMTPEQRSAEFLYSAASIDEFGKPMSALQLLAKEYSHPLSFSRELAWKVRKGLNLTVTRDALKPGRETTAEAVQGSPLDQIMRVSGVLHAAEIARRGATLAVDEHPSKYLTLVEAARHNGQAPSLASPRELTRTLRLMKHMGINLNIPFVPAKGELTSAEPWPFPRGSNTTPAAAWSAWAAHELKKTQEAQDLRYSGSGRALRTLDCVLGEVASHGVDFSQLDETGRTVTKVKRLVGFRLGSEEEDFRELLAKHENFATRQASLKRIHANVSARRAKRFADLVARESHDPELD